MCCQDKIWAIKTDINGDTSWTKSWANVSEGLKYPKQISTDIGYDIMQDNDGNYVVTGRMWSWDDWQSGSVNAILIKFQPNFTTDVNTLTHENNKKIKSITNLLGQETPIRKNTTMFYIYNDGTVEKKLIIE